VSTVKVILFRILADVPKLWNATIETHRAAVRDAILDATLALVAERGLRGVTMAEVAARAGIGRATLYKYFGDAETILRAWHEREIGRHLAEMGAIAEAAAAGAVRGDVTPDELAAYCLAALAAAGELRSAAAVRRLVTITLAGLRP